MDSASLLDLQFLHVLVSNFPVINDVDDELLMFILLLLLLLLTLPIPAPKPLDLFSLACEL